MVVTRNRLSCERSKNRRNVSHQASSLGDDREKKTSSILPRKRETGKEQERVVAKSRSGKNCRGNHLRMGIGKKLLGVERESRVQRSVFVLFLSIVFPSTLQCICTVEAWRD